MSVYAIAWAKRQKTGSPTRKAVLTALADYADEHGKGWPSVGRLAEDTELSVRAVQNALRELVEAGIIERRERPGENGVTRAFLYCLPLSDPKPRAREKQGRVQEVQGRVQEVQGGEGAPGAGGRVQEVRGHYVEPLPRTTSRTFIEEANASSHPEPSFGGTFDEFYKAYPNKKAKEAAKRAFDKVRKERKATFAELMDGVERYKANKDPDYKWAHPASWLNAGRWADEYDEPSLIPRTNGFQRPVVDLKAEAEAAYAAIERRKARGECH